jgi:hypothetical protein
MPRFIVWFRTVGIVLLAARAWQTLAVFCGAVPLRSRATTEENVSFARDQFGLDPIETQILQLLLRYERNSYLERFADQVSQSSGALHEQWGP